RAKVLVEFLPPGRAAERGLGVATEDDYVAVPRDDAAGLGDLNLRPRRAHRQRPGPGGGPARLAGLLGVVAVGVGVSGDGVGAGQRRALIAERGLAAGVGGGGGGGVD